MAFVVHSNRSRMRSLVGPVVGAIRFFRTTLTMFVEETSLDETYFIFFKFWIQTVISGTDKNMFLKKQTEKKIFNKRIAFTREHGDMKSTN